MAIVTHLIVDERGAYIGKHQGRLQVRLGRQIMQEAPLLHLEQVLVNGRAVSLSADAVSACAGQGIPIHFISYRGTPYASLYTGGLIGTVQTRRAQILAYTDQRSVVLGKAFARSKISNQAALLRYLAKYRKERDPAVHTELIGIAEDIERHLKELDRLQAARVEEARPKLLGIEGRAAQRYWEGVKLAVAVEADWPGRRGRGAQDVLNSALNYAYGILYGQVEWAIVLAGLDPYAGFVHTDRPGKPSLVLDLIEEFRQAAADRPVFAMVNKGTTIELDEQGLLTQKSRQALAEKVLQRLDKEERYERKKVPLRIIIQSQARHMATFLRGDRIRYTPFLAHW
ncbi:MAG: CRISPR-associated endonuclease Cas1 [Candidatus Methanosuratus sp.]|nr:CRISPR-associated endonuclease Cas1 [Candidatus Methanosuratincola sp.]